MKAGLNEGSMQFLLVVMVRNNQATSRVRFRSFTHDCRVKMQSQTWTIERRSEGHAGHNEGHNAGRNDAMRDGSGGFRLGVWIR